MRERRPVDERPGRSEEGGTDGQPTQLETAPSHSSTRAPGQETIVVTSLTDEIAFRLESAILDGIYPPGSRLIQDELCERFGVSRTPIREALRKLEARNLIRVVPNRGATVSIATRRELMESYDVRSQLEGYACLLAARNVTDEMIGDLDAAQERIVALIGELEGDPADGADLGRIHLELNRANDDFHGVIHRGARNERLQQIISELSRVFPKEFFWRGIRTSEEMRTLNLDEHDVIRAALAAGDAEGGRDAIREHIIHARTVLLRYLTEQAFWR